MLNRFACLAFYLWAAVLLVPYAQANVISFTGDLKTNATFLPPVASPTDGDYAQWAAVVEDFHVTSTSAMDAITFSYGGGTNGNGAMIAQSGFEPYLSLFDSAGDFLASTFGVGCPSRSNTNSDSGFCYDIELDGGTLLAGDYQIAISAYENMSFAENLGTGTLADGFTGLGNLYDGEDLHYAFDVELTPTTVATPVPEPSTLLPAVGSFASYLLYRRR